MSTKVLVELILTFRRINSYLTGFGQRFIGTLAHIQIFKSGNHTRPFNKLRKKHKEHSSFLPHTCSFILLTTYFILHTFSSNAQLLTPLSNEMNRRVEYEMIQNGTPFFTVMKPYVITPTPKSPEITPRSPEGDLRESLDSLTHLQIDSSSNLQISSHLQINTSSNLQIPPSAHHSWFHRKLFHESLIQVDSGSFYLFADPVFEFGVGRESKGRNTVVNTRGLRIGGQLGKYFAFGTDFYENQAIFNSALDAQFRTNKVIPGQGRGRVNGNTWDYAHASGYISFSPIKPLNVRFGQGKHFIGDGYRSLILSDAAYTYPYASATWQSKKWMYTWMVSSVQNLGIKIARDKEPFKRETISVHLLSLQLSHRIQLSLVQSQLFNIPDTFGRTKADIRLFNPLLLPVADNSNVHSIWGMNLKVNLNRYIILYGQLVIDNLISSSRKNMGMQLGLKYFDVAGIRGLYAQTEYNRIDPDTYTSTHKALQWMHFGEPLAHPLGSNIEEVMVSLSYTWQRWQINNQTNLISNKESLNKYTAITNPPLPQYTTGQQLLWNRSELVFYINPKTLMNLAIGYMYRKETLTGSTNTLSQFYFTFRTSLLNMYYDR